MRFLGTGSAVPEKILTNDMISTMVETSDEWIKERTGICERRISEGETVADLAVRASRNALEAAGGAHTNAHEAAAGGAHDTLVGENQLSAQDAFTARDIDVVICSTLSSMVRCPSIACVLQRELGLREDILAFDLNAACTGFIYALIVASRFVSEGKTALIVGAEVLSPLVDFTDRSTCILFGDGAGALIVAPSLTQPAEGAGQENRHVSQQEILPWVTEAHGDDELIKITDTIFMDGPGVFEFAVKVIIRSVREVVAKADFALEDIDHFICHQANERIIKSAAKRLKLPLERFFMNLAHYGNTSAASIPLALDEVVRSGAIKPGDKVVMAGFGGGLTVGAVCFTWN